MPFEPEPCKFGTLYGAPVTVDEEYVLDYLDEDEILNRLLLMERKLERIIVTVERLERWFGPEFDEEGNVVK